MLKMMWNLHFLVFSAKTICRHFFMWFFYSPPQTQVLSLRSRSWCSWKHWNKWVKLVNWPWFRNKFQLKRLFDVFVLIWSSCFMLEVVLCLLSRLFSQICFLCVMYSKQFWVKASFFFEISNSQLSEKWPNHFGLELSFLLLCPCIFILNFL